MIDRHRLRHQALGAALFFAWLFLALSLLGYRPQDPPGTALWSPAPEVRNPCGPVGALLAHLAFQTIGWASLVVLLALAVGWLHLARRRPMPETGLRVGGVALVVLVVSALLGALDARLGASALGRSPAIGSGGYTGAIASAVLGGQFGPLGMVLILSALGLLGGVLCHDVFVVWPIRELYGLISRRRGGSTADGAAAGVGTALAVPAASPFELEPAESFRPARPALTYPPVTAAIRGPSPRRNQPVLPLHSVPRRPDDGSYQPPPMDLLERPPANPVQEQESLIQTRAMILEKTLREHGCVVRVVQIDTGPVITMFEIELEAGLRVSKIVGLSADLAIALAVQSVRIVSPIPGKTTVGIEVPNESREVVRLSEVMSSTDEDPERMRIPLFLGKDVKGQPMVFDLAEMPHLLIAGRTGTGKSVCLNAMILSILMTRRPDEVKLLLIDPKKVELNGYARIPHLMHPVVTDMKKAEALLSWACDKMDERYSYLSRAGVRNIKSYNALGPEEIYARLQPESEEERQRIPTYMPHIVIIADEMADLMMTAAKEVETHIVRLAQLARAVGMHLILATQKPTVDVITGLIKGNLPARIAFQVTSRSDSRVILDEMGAERLLGNGDMLFLKPATSHILRAQGTFVSDLEVNRICAYLEQYPVEFSRELVQLQVSGGSGGKNGSSLKDRDELYETAIEVVIREGRGSTSMLQRALGIGYGRAARLIDYMAEDGIVGEFKSGSAREVLYTWDEWEALKNGGDEAGTAA
jgi:S-DNA-T family DNA segregation ATPase FtsK/SpoIIIE